MASTWRRVTGSGLWAGRAMSGDSLGRRSLLERLSRSKIARVHVRFCCERPRAAVGVPPTGRPGKTLRVHVRFCKAAGGAGLRVPPGPVRPEGAIGDTAPTDLA